MRLRLQPQSIVCYFSALWLLATARSCSYATNLFSSMGVTDAKGQSVGPTGRIFGELVEGKENNARSKVLCVCAYFLVCILTKVEKQKTKN